MTRFHIVRALSIVALAAACRSQDTGPGNAPSSNETRVRVSGANAQVEDDGSITLRYPENQDLNHRVPNWVINPAMGGVTGAVGVASPSPLGTREQLDQARWNGRLEMASMLELRVQRIARSELEEDRRVNRGTDESVARRDTLGIDKEILDIVLAGSRQRALWWDLDTGELYVWVVLDGAVLDRATQSILQGVSVFTASAKLPSEYLPKREQPKPPTVIVDLPSQPEPAEPEPQKTPIEELESALKPIETIPSKESE